MRQKNINKIYNLCLIERTDFEKNYPTGKKLAEAINQVFQDDWEETDRKRLKMLDIQELRNSWPTWPPDVKLKK